MRISCLFVLINLIINVLSEQKIALLIVGDSTSKRLVQSIYKISKCQDKTETIFYQINSRCDDDIFIRVDSVSTFGVSPVNEDYFMPFPPYPGYKFRNSWATALRHVDLFLNQSIHEPLRVVSFTSNFWDAGRLTQQLQPNKSVVSVSSWLEE